jgi:hypothetical protein
MQYYSATKLTGSSSSGSQARSQVAVSGGYGEAAKIFFLKNENEMTCSESANLS